MLRFLDNAEDYLCRALLVLFVTLLFVQVLMRELFSYGLPWIEELSRFAFVWFSLLGAAYAAKLNAHNRVELHLKLLPKKVYAIVMLLVDLIWIAFNITITWKAWTVIEDLLRFPYTSPALEWSMAYVYMIIPIAFVLMSLRVLQVHYNRIVHGVEPIDVQAMETQEIADSAVHGGKAQS
ncbi:MAG: TRAP transporter small permease [Candidatus Competibacterales bacterium]|nr:TRAP transporter small permease [Candidatus Competibacterales bacterium]